MAVIQKFEDIEAWQKARELARVVYAFSGTGPFARDFGLCDQIRRAAVSVMSNIAEGFERGGSAEFSQFLAIAKALPVRSKPNFMWRSTRVISKKSCSKPPKP